MPPIDFDLRQLEIFCKVVEMNSFSKAADVVFLAQASVSERIANLEKDVGARLLDRLGRRVVPTKAGELLYKHAVLLLDMKRTARLEMENFLGLRRGELHMGGSTIPGEYILPRVIGRFHEKYPYISVTLTIADTSEIEGLVHGGGIELGVIGSKSSRKDLLHYELWKDELVLAVHPGHRWAKKGMITLDELLKEPVILREPGSGTLKIIEDYLKASGPEDIGSFNTVARFGTSTAVKEAVKSGFGVSILSSRALQTEMEAGLLYTVKIRGLPALSRSFYLIRDRRRIASPLCQAMFEFLQGSREDEKETPST